MNESQRRQINEARVEAIKCSHKIDATGKHSPGYIVNSAREFDALDRRQAGQCSRDDQAVHSMPMYQKDGVS